MKKLNLLFSLVFMTLIVKSQTTVTLNLQNTCLITSVEDAELLDFHISPNPATNQFQLSVDASGTIGKTAVKIFTSQGELVFEQQFYSESRTLMETIITEGLSSGLYLISVQRNEDVYTKTIVLNK